jgi:hypothetical protein
LFGIWDGEVVGCITGKVLLEKCAQGCSTSDAGVGFCKGGEVDAGASSDAGSVSCCPAKHSGGGCHYLGGAKNPPHGCRMVCCESCNWFKGTDSHGCTTWTPVTQDAGAPHG